MQRGTAPRFMPLEILSHASSTSGPLPTYGDQLMTGVKLYRTVSYLTTGAAGAESTSKVSLCLLVVAPGKYSQYVENCVVTTKSDGGIYLMQKAKARSVVETESSTPYATQTRWFFRFTLHADRGR